MTDEITIPILPCPSINEMLTFYRALGFEVTYQEARPNTYAVVERGGITLHFFVLKGLEPSQSYSTCFVLVPDADELYQAFASGLRQHYGRLPSAGIPRLTRLKDKSGGIRGFNVIDPGGNWIRIGQKIEATDTEKEPAQPKSTSTRLSRAILAADLLADSKGDFEAAAKMLDAALAHDDPALPVQQVQALVLRASLAISLNDTPLASKLLTDVRAMSLSEEDRTALVEELGQMKDLEDALS